MNKINFILVLVLLISSCSQPDNKNKTPKSSAKRDLGKQKYKKTPEKAFRES
ncbi:Lipoprotein (plasmid) [Borrelia hermsii YBT]|uniref:Lipoprotein n=1 Tax=Borrelia hermsii YBT TaxID=1313295 RepID=W5T1C6_BORHE|nr:hypothetical protein [Borrelia hermsii]AHH13334.1 Lipoprotein [Borrelia hermsii YBT]